jgi:hypothetical protein
MNYSCGLFVFSSFLFLARHQENPTTVNCWAVFRFEIFLTAGMKKEHSDSPSNEKDISDASNTPFYLY